MFRLVSSLLSFILFTITSASFQSNIDDDQFINKSIITLIGTGSGIPDISFNLNTDILQSILKDYQLNPIPPQLSPEYVMGYRATKIKSSNITGFLRHDAEEHKILEQMFKYVSIKESIKFHIFNRISIYINSTIPQLISMPFTKSNDASSNKNNASSNQNNASCTPPIVGPDSWIDTDYDVQTDDCGFFTGEYQTENNCYAYGTNIATNTYPQPGRGSGQEWTSNTCQDIFAAAERDGLVYVGTELENYWIGPSDGHYVALYIWPNTNFHWARMDYNGTYNQSDQVHARRWSHKPGGTPVQTVDNNGNCIGYPSPCVLPSNADLSPWSEFCGYMIAVPSQLTID